MERKFPQFSLYETITLSLITSGFNTNPHPPFIENFPSLMSIIKPRNRCPVASVMHARLQRDRFLEMDTFRKLPLGGIVRDYSHAGLDTRRPLRISEGVPVTRRCASEKAHLAFDN